MRRCSVILITNFQLKMMVQLQIPLANRSVQEESWKVKLAERLSGRKLGDFGEPEDIAETAAFLSSSRYIIWSFNSSE